MPLVEHGPKWRGLPTPSQTVMEALSALNVVVGAFPVHLAARPVAAHEATLVLNYQEAVATHGYSDNWEKFPCCESLFSHFVEFGTGPVAFINVLDRNKLAHTSVKANVELDIAVQSDGRVEPILLPDDFVLRDTVVLKNDDGTLAYEEDADYTLSLDDDGRVLVHPVAGGGILEAGEENVTIPLKAFYTCLNPGGVTAADIIGGIDLNTGKKKGLELLGQINAKYGDPYIPGLLVAPGFTEDVNVAAVVQAKTERMGGMYGCIALLDIDCGTSGARWYQEALAKKKANGLDSENAIALWPRLRSGEKIMHFSARLGAAMAYLDATDGRDSPRETPSSKPVLKITDTCLADGTEINVQQDEAELLNVNGIVTAIRTDSLVPYGNYTCAAGRTNDPALYQITLRRMINWIGNTCVMNVRRRVDNLERIELVTETLSLLNGWISGLVGLRSVAPGTQTLFREQDNPDSDLRNGKLRIYIDYGGYIPAQVIEVLIGYNDQHMLNELRGGMSNG